MNDPTALREFEAYIKTEYSEENLYFYLACVRLRFATLAQVERFCSEIQQYVCVRVHQETMERYGSAVGGM